jgi:hypothetical protein
MITLNTEKGLVRIDSWEEVIERPGFVANLDPDTVELEAIIGSYLFKDHVKCGLSSCHQPHGRGYLVTTKDGQETNIGKDCGKKHFSVDFETMRKAYERDFQNKEWREQLETIQRRIPSYLDAIKNIRSGNTGADSLYALLQSMTPRGKGVPETVVEEISKMVKARNGRITRQRQATDLEIENLEAIQAKEIRRPHYIEEEIGHMAGISALYPEYNLRELLVLDVTKGLEHIQQLDIPSLSEGELRDQSKWALGLDVKLNTAKQTVREAKIFLSPSNLSKLDVLIREKDGKRSFSKFLAQLRHRLEDEITLPA